MVEIEKLRASVDQPRKAYVVVPRDAGVAHVQIRGNPSQPGEIVTAGGVAGITGLTADFGLGADAPEAQRRIRLAAWVSSPRNPLFTRVVVNRLWQAHFGTGLVEMSSDLGFNGGRPSHPELLDWLASELVAREWSLKAMHRLIVTSAAYRQSSRSDPAALRLDAADRLLWRKAPTRLEAEMVRDALLALAGKLDTKLGGPSFRDEEIVQSAGTPAILYSPVDPGRPGLDRRHALPGVGTGRPKPVPRHFRLPRSVDDGSAPRRHDHAAPGTFVDEQRLGPALCRRRWRLGWHARRVLTLAGRSSWLTASRSAASRNRLSESGPCEWSSSSGRRAWRERSSIATSSSISIERLAVRLHGPSRVLLLDTERIGGGRRRLIDAARRHAAGWSTRRRKTGLSPLRPGSQARHPHLPVRGDEPRRYI